MITYGCRPKFRIKGNFINNTADTLIWNSNSTFTILPHATFPFQGVWDKAYPDKNFHCCPCELHLGTVTLSPLSKNKRLTKDINSAQNWDQLTDEARSSRYIDCSFTVNQSDLVP
jgi:hypothetical protein